MITTRDGVVKNAGQFVWSIGRDLKEEKFTPIKLMVAHRPDAYLEQFGCWHSREACQAECDRLNNQKEKP